MTNVELVVIKWKKRKMRNDEFEFLKEAKVWFFGTLIGTICSAIGIIADNKIVSLIGLLVSAAVTLYYAYQCWQSSQWYEGD